MANIENGQVMANNKGELFTIIQVDDKAKTAILKSEETGFTRNYSFPTLKDKRRFTFIQSPEEVAPIMDLDNPISEQEAEEFGMVTGEEALEQAVTVPEEAGEESHKSRITITYKGVTKSPKEWGEEFNLNPKYIRLQLRKGKSPEEIFGE